MFAEPQSSPAALLLTPRATAQALAISERTLFTLTRAGRIRAVRIGKRGIRYDRADLTAFISSAKN